MKIFYIICYTILVFGMLYWLCTLIISINPLKIQVKFAIISNGKTWYTESYRKLENGIEFLPEDIYGNKWNSTTSIIGNYVIENEQ